MRRLVRAAGGVVLCYCMVSQGLSAGTTKVVFCFLYYVGVISRPSVLVFFSRYKTKKKKKKQRTPIRRAAKDIREYSNGSACTPLF